MESLRWGEEEVRPPDDEESWIINPLCVLSFEGRLVFAGYVLLSFVTGSWGRRTTLVEGGASGLGAFNQTSTEAALSDTLG